MKILNLVNKEESEIKYDIINYPDQQKDIVITPFEFIHNIQSGLGLTLQESVQIKSRLNNAEDLLMIICATKALRNLKVKEIHLYTPYIMGLRSDRLFQEGGNRYVKDIIAPILNAQNFESVTCIDAHSSVAENCINNLINISNAGLFREAMRGLYGLATARKNDDFVLVSPDAGAAHKIYKLAQDVDYKGDIITCSKERDKDGKLSKCVVPLDHRESKDFIIIDDICDGGQTFINIAKELKRLYLGIEDISPIKIYLIVTHGIFSKGFVELNKYFDAIYTTDSYSDLTKINTLGSHRVKQLDVF